MSRSWPPALTRSLAGTAFVVICLSVGLLTWFGSTAIREWQRSSALLADRRVKGATDLLATALRRDMEAAQHTVLLSVDLGQFAFDPSYDIINLVASAFARYPYPESFFAWHRDQAGAVPVFFNRRDRPPRWTSADTGPNRFPVVIGGDIEAARAIFERIQVDARKAQPFSVFETEIGGTRYQVVARLLYRDALREQLGAVFGFTVNLPWVRQHYFAQLTSQVARVAGTVEGLNLIVADDRGTPVSGTLPNARPGAASAREFPLMFFDPLLVAVDLPVDFTSRRFWTVQANTAGDPSLVWAERGVKWMLGLGALGAVAVVLGSALALRAARANYRLAELRSDFVAAVSHELKTPIATIRAIGETLLSGRAQSPAAQHDYAGLVVQEAKRLTRSVENLLAFSRVTDVAAVYRFEPMAIDALIKDTLEGLKLQLVEAGFDVMLDVEDQPLTLLGDRAAIGLMLDNLLDNSIRYSGAERRLDIRARRADTTVVLEVSDRGRGIPEDEIERVTHKFYRGRNASSGGTGLGLAIAQRIVNQHGGTLRIRSDVGVGTTVTVDFPAMAAHEESAHSGR